MTSQPAPTGGLNARDGLADMPPSDAIVMDNWFPERSFAELRKGYAAHATGLGSAPVETLATWQGATPIMLAVTGGSVFNVTGAGAVGAAVATGLSNSRLQHINFSNTGGTWLLAVNGADGLLSFNGTTWGVQSVTGMDATKAICIASWKRRVWLGEAGTSKAWYLGTDAISGPATELNLGGVWRLGGTIAGILSASFDGNAGVSEYIGFMSSLGELALYQGSDPASAASFALVGVFRLSPPVGRRFFVQIGGDLAIITADGVVSAMKSLSIDRSTALSFAVTDKINPLIAAAYAEFGTAFGWQLLVYPAGHRLFLNVPGTPNGGPPVQYVMNTLSGAWCRYTGHHAACWELLNERVYFGGTDGVVYQADTGLLDNGQPLPYDLQLAPSYFGQRRPKRFTLVRPNMTATGPLNASITVGVDYGTDDEPSATLITEPGTALFDQAEFDEAVFGYVLARYRAWVPVSGVGTVGSIRLTGQARLMTMQIAAIDVQFERAARLGT